MGYTLAIAFMDALAGHLTQHTQTPSHKHTRKLTVHSKPTTQRTLVMSFRFSGLVTPDGTTSRRFEPACGGVAVAGTGLHILRSVFVAPPPEPNLKNITIFTKFSPGAPR